MAVTAHRPTGGLTMLELAITLAVMAVLGALALPTMGQRLQHQRLQHAAETLAGDLAETRFLAAQRGQTLYVQAAPGTPWCWSVAAVPVCDCGSPLPCQVRRVVADEHPGVRIVQGGTVSLDPTGAGSGQTLAMFESSHGDRLRVDLTPLGRPHICAAVGSWPRLPACSPPAS